MATKKKKSSSIFDALRNTFGNPKYGRRQFKRDVKKLVKQGLYHPTTGVESIQPGRYVNSILRKFSDVLAGRAQAIQVNPGEVKKYKEQGFRVKSGRAIVEVPKGATAHRVRAQNGVPRFEVVQKTRTGTRRTTRELVPLIDLESRIRRSIEEQPELQKGEFLGLRFFGNNTAQYWADKQLMLEFVLHYPSVVHALNEMSPEDQQEYYQNFEVVRFTNQKAWGAEYNARKQEQQQQRNRSAEMRRRARERERYAQMDELEKRIYKEKKYKDREQRAERERARRAQLKHDDPSAYAKMLEKNAARVKKSRSNKK